MTCNQYTVRISNEPSYYGADCTQQQADEIAARLAGMIREQFDGINVEVFRDGEHSTALLGPDDAVCEEIERWVNDHWTAAL
jgi:hypothetical protein